MNYVLKCCPLALQEGRFTYRHDGVLKYIATCLDKDKYTCYIDIPGHRHPAGGTLPPDVAVTILKPDIVIVDKQKKTVSILELTCPAEHRISAANALKMDKYSHFETDQNGKNVTVKPFEIGSHTGYITAENKTRLAHLHKFCKKSIKLKNFVKNISAITVMGSYFIFNSRSQVVWPETAHISAPFSNQ